MQILFLGTYSLILKGYNNDSWPLQLHHMYNMSYNTYLKSSSSSLQSSPLIVRHHTRAWTISSLYSRTESLLCSSMMLQSVHRLVEVSDICNAPTGTRTELVSSKYANSHRTYLSKIILKSIQFSRLPRRTTIVEAWPYTVDVRNHQFNNIYNWFSSIQSWSIYIILYLMETLSF